MAKYNEILVGRYNKFLYKLMGMKGAAVAPQLSSDIQAVIPFFNGAENRYLESWGRFALAMNLAAVAGNRNLARLRNPAGSNLVVVVERILVSVAVVDQPMLTFIQTAAPDAASLVGAGSTGLDNRGPTTPNSSLSQSSTAGGNQGLTIMQVNMPINSSFDFIPTDVDELPLAPGSAYTVYSNVANQAIIVSFLWRERFIEDSERT